MMCLNMSCRYVNPAIETVKVKLILMTKIQEKVKLTLITTRIANAIFHLSAFARLPVLHGTIITAYLCLIDGTIYLVKDK